MTHLLHISASPRSERSESIALAAAYLAEVADRPDVEVEEWDLWDGTLPDFGPDATGAKMSVFAGQEPTGPQAEAWARTTRAFERFDAADAYLFSVPMWNGSVPYVLKQLIDVVSQPGMVFGFDALEGYSGLLAGKKAVLVLTSAVYGPERPPAFGVDFQRSYLEWWLNWAGVEDVTTVELRPNLATDHADELRAAAHEQVREAALKL